MGKIGGELKIGRKSKCRGDKKSQKSDIDAKPDLAADGMNEFQGGPSVKRQGYLALYHGAKNLITTQPMCF